MKEICSVGTFKGNKNLNQDRFCVDKKIISHDSPRIDCELEFAFDEDLHVVAVADGVTNSIDGGKAAEIVIKSVYESYDEVAFSHSDIKESLDDIIDNAASMLRWEYKDYLTDVSAASTISIVVFNKNRIWAYNLGDSPILLIRNNKIIPLFHEDTLGAEKLEKQKGKNFASRLFQKESPPTEKEFNCLTKCVSNHCYSVDGNFTSVDFLEDDVILVASDGLFKVIQENEAIGVKDSKTLIEKTVNYASDNVTVAIIRKEGDDNIHVTDENEG
ncbi:MAG: PP2C family protein-serine/threonine phosphatase [Bacillota bacterium]|nr:PP2C family protein-serine/threonine phosphatase [Bacillota bacterium]